MGLEALNILHFPCDTPNLSSTAIMQHEIRWRYYNYYLKHLEFV